ncbi:hypothetical protein EDI_031830 [Entamoeba dispar SAW760]|uniref:HTH myb-type domain-containing protein n=1 Tax=Entamoeba dispar (strain ATCC PRA-260 / SAW760) TaxID=370354 RepID=B0EQP3_ENTDS|nr:uncharacterized protein EDI_031830 [Entamoeba dispar SAW760]EDR23162.1 hypothetical protein EDI_031830 [Entamoeba dispar SAW760]|eukprot:EDR23162.1 hypothetical protein EDI_031830 [Entamoeba dispar SAW760]
MDSNRYFNLPEPDTQEFVDKVIFIYRFQKETLQRLDSKDNSIYTRVENSPIMSDKDNEMIPYIYSTEIKPQKTKRYWTKEECLAFEKIIKFLNINCGQALDFRLISLYVKTRTPTQVRSHAQKYFLKERENKCVLTPQDIIELSTLIKNYKLMNKHGNQYHLLVK